MATAVMGEQSVSLTGLGHTYYLAAMATSEWTEISCWELVPGLLVQWIQAQPGLNVQGNPITNREELIRAYLLIRCKGDLNGLCLAP